MNVDEISCRKIVLINWTQWYCILFVFWRSLPVIVDIQLIIFWWTSIICSCIYVNIHRIISRNSLIATERLQFPNVSTACRNPPTIRTFRSNVLRIYMNNKYIKKNQNVLYQNCILYAYSWDRLNWTIERIQCLNSALGSQISSPTCNTRRSGSIKN